MECMGPRSLSHGIYSEVGKSPFSSKGKRIKRQTIGQPNQACNHYWVASDILKGSRLNWVPLLGMISQSPLAFPSSECANKACLPTELYLVPRPKDVWSRTESRRLIRGPCILEQRMPFPPLRGTRPKQDCRRTNTEPSFHRIVSKQRRLFVSRDLRSSRATHSYE